MIPNNSSISMFLKQIHLPCMLLFKSFLIDKTNHVFFDVFLNKINYYIERMIIDYFLYPFKK